MSALMQITFDYNTEVKDLPEEQYAKLQKVMPKIFEGPQKDWAKSYTDHLIDERDATLLSDCDIKYSVTKFKGQMHVDLPYIQGSEKVQSIHIHVPNIGLLAVDEVMYLTDACTNDLQDRLDKGWRILCVCPPNNERRPTYILGRTKGFDK